MWSNTIYSDARNYAGGVSATLTAFIAILTSVPQPVLVRTTFLMLGSNTTNLIDLFVEVGDPYQRNHIFNRRSEKLHFLEALAAFLFVEVGCFSIFFHIFSMILPILFKISQHFFGLVDKKHVLLIFVTTKKPRVPCANGCVFFVEKPRDDWFSGVSRPPPHWLSLFCRTDDFARFFFIFLKTIHPMGPPIWCWICWIFVEVRKKVLKNLMVNLVVFCFSLATSPIF